MRLPIAVMPLGETSNRSEQSVSMTMLVLTGALRCCCLARVLPVPRVEISTGSASSLSFWNESALVSSSAIIVDSDDDDDPGELFACAERAARWRLARTDASTAPSQTWFFLGSPHQRHRYSLRPPNVARPCFDRGEPGPPLLLNFGLERCGVSSSNSACAGFLIDLRSRSRRVGLLASYALTASGFIATGTGSSGGAGSSSGGSSSASPSASRTSWLRARQPSSKSSVIENSIAIDFGDSGRPYPSCTRAIHAPPRGGVSASLSSLDLLMDARTLHSVLFCGAPGTGRAGSTVDLARVLATSRFTSLVRQHIFS